MTQWTCQQGQTLLIPSGPKEGHKHLFALMLQPSVVEGYGSKPVVMLACVTSFVNGQALDDSCVLTKGDHQFIEHDSYIDYRFTRIEQAELIQTRVQEGIFIEKEQCSPDLLKRIINGALKSRKIPREFKAVLENVLFS